MYQPITSALALDYAKSNGLLMLNSAQQLDHIAFTLKPSPFAATAFQQAQQLAPDFSQLMVAIANDQHFLTDILQKLGDADPFSQQLGQLYRQSYIDSAINQSISLGIWRSDYLLDTTATLRQVEINLVAAAFPAFASKITHLHQLLYPELHTQLPDNAALTQTVAAFAAAWRTYGNENASVCFVQQNNERNRFDQLALATELWQKFGIKSLFRNLASLAEQAYLQNNKLYIKQTEIALVYFRAGYVPDDYPSKAIWQLRLLLERSLAIKCPSLPYQLSGMKIVQQHISQSSLLANFVSDTETQQRLQACFMPFYSLDQNIDKALNNPEQYVLKPQREGGGHNLYGQAWVQQLKTLSKKQQNAWVLMQLIDTKTTENQLIINGKATQASPVISELGIYQSCLSDGKNYQHHTAGHLLRTKFAHHQEGGIAAGFAALDSPLLT